MAGKRKPKIKAVPVETGGWLKVVKRSTYPSQITRIITHSSAEAYFKDAKADTTRSQFTCEELDAVFGGADRSKFQDFGWAAIKEATNPEALLQGIQYGTVNALQAVLPGLKAFSLVTTQDPEQGVFNSLTFTCAASDGTYETTITLVKR